MSEGMSEGMVSEGMTPEGMMSEGMTPALTSEQFSTHLALGMSRKLVMFFSSRV